MASKEDKQNPFKGSSRSFCFLKGNIGNVDQVLDVLENIVETMAEGRDKLEVYASVGSRTLSLLTEELKKTEDLGFYKAVRKFFGKDLCETCSQKLITKITDMEKMI